MSDMKDSFLCLKREPRISGTNEKAVAWEVSVDRAGILSGPGEPVGPILSPLGRREWHSSCRCSQPPGLLASALQVLRTWRGLESGSLAILHQGWG